MLSLTTVLCEGHAPYGFCGCNAPGFIFLIVVKYRSLVLHNFPTYFFLFYFVSLLIYFPTYLLLGEETHSISRLDVIKGN